MRFCKIVMPSVFKLSLVSNWYRTCITFILIFLRVIIICKNFYWAAKIREMEFAIYDCDEAFAFAAFTFFALRFSSLLISNNSRLVWPLMLLFSWARRIR